MSVPPGGVVDVSVGIDRIESRARVEYGGTRWFLYQAWETLLVREHPVAHLTGPRVRVDRYRTPDVSQLAFESAPLTFGRLAPRGLYRRMIQPLGARAWSSSLRERDTLAIDTASEPAPMEGVLLSPPLMDAWFLRRAGGWESIGCAVGPGRRRKPFALVYARERSLEMPDLAREGWVFERAPRRTTSNDRIGFSLDTGRLFARWGASAEWWTWSAPGHGAGSLASGEFYARWGLLSLRAHGRFASDRFYEPDGDFAARPVVLSSEAAAGTARSRAAVSLRYEGEGPLHAPAAEWKAIPAARVRARRPIPAEARAELEVRGFHGRVDSYTPTETLILGGRILRFQARFRGEERPRPGLPNKADVDVRLRAPSGAVSLSVGTTCNLSGGAWYDLSARLLIKALSGLELSANVTAAEARLPDSLPAFAASGAYEAEFTVRWKL